MSGVRSASNSCLYRSYSSVKQLFKVCIPQICSNGQFQQNCQVITGSVMYLLHNEWISCGVLHPNNACYLTTELTCPTGMSKSGSVYQLYKTAFWFNKLYISYKWNVYLLSLVLWTPCIHLILNSIRFLSKFDNHKWLTTRKVSDPAGWKLGQSVQLTFFVVIYLAWQYLLNEVKTCDTLACIMITFLICHEYIINMVLVFLGLYLIASK